MDFWLALKCEFYTGFFNIYVHNVNGALILLVYFGLPMVHLIECSSAFHNLNTITDLVQNISG